MGDFRADIKIEMNLIGRDYKYDAWINYFPDDCGVDRRIREWFEECWNDAKSRYDERLAKIYKKEHKMEIEEVERRQLSELQRKYPNP